MPRPTVAQLAYGSATVVFSTVAMLLLSGTHSGAGVTVIAVAGLALGLLVAVTVPLPRTARQARRRAPAPGLHAGPVQGPRADARAGAGTVPRARIGSQARARARVEEHSLRG